MKFTNEKIADHVNKMKLNFPTKSTEWCLVETARQLNTKYIDVVRATCRDWAKPPISTKNNNCKANGCWQEVTLERLMCSKHWFMVPKNMQMLIPKYYRQGRRIDQQADLDYLVLMDMAVWYVNGFKNGTGA